MDPYLYPLIFGRTKILIARFRTAMTVSRCVAEAALKYLGPLKIRNLGHSMARKDPGAVPAKYSAMHGRSDINGCRMTLTSNWRPARHGEHGNGGIESGVAS